MIKLTLFCGVLLVSLFSILEFSFWSFELLVDGCLNLNCRRLFRPVHFLAVTFHYIQQLVRNFFSLTLEGIDLN